MPPRGRSDVYDAVVSWIEDHGYSPTYRDIAGMLNISVSTVHLHVRRLIAEGSLCQDEGASRTLRQETRG